MEKRELEKALDIMTLSEIKKKYNIPKTKIDKLIKEYNLEVKYCGRTPYTNQLLPVSDKVIAKYSDKKKRQKTNEMMLSDMEERNWPQREIESRLEDIKNYDYRIGVLLSDINNIQKEINDLVRYKINQQFMISIGRKTIETKDYCGYVEEERYGKRPEITKFDTSLITDKMVLGYLSKRLSPENLSVLATLLKNEK